MPDDALSRVLELVATGRLSAEEAAPILDALQAGQDAVTTGRKAVDAGFGAAAPFTAHTADGEAEGDGPRQSGAKFARIEVREGGRRVVDLRIPTSLGRFALGRVPGLSTDQVSELQNAISTGIVGPLLDVEDEDGDGVRIVLE
jgi:hypothetical protein